MATKKRTVSPDPSRAVCVLGGPSLGLTAAHGRLVTSMMGYFRGGKMVDQVRLWDAVTGTEVGRFGTGDGSVCWQAATSPDGSLLAAGFGDCTFRVWDTVTGKERLREKLGGIVASVSWSDDGRHVFTGNCGDKTVRLWDVTAGKVVAQCKAPRSIAWFTAVAGDLRVAASGNADKAVHLWAPRACTLLGALQGHTGKILGLAFSRDGARLASASQDGTARVWDPSSSRCVAVLAGHTGPVLAVCFTDDGAPVTSSADGTVRVWRGETHADARVWHLGETAAYGVATLGDEVFAGCADGTVRAWTEPGAP